MHMNESRSQTGDAIFILFLCPSGRIYSISNTLSHLQAKQHTLCSDFHYRTSGLRPHVHLV